jgi:hypothetical protein
MSGDRVFRQEGLTAAPAGGETDVIGQAHAAYDARRINASKGPSRKQRERMQDGRANSKGSFETFNGNAAIAKNRETDNGVTAVARGRAANGFGTTDEPNAEDARQAMDQKKKDAWKKTPPRKDRARAR